MQIALAQINPTLGDFEGNYQKILEYCAKANEDGADIVVFPELAISGYNPEDLALRKTFMDESKHWLNQLVIASDKWNVAIVVGAVFLNPEPTDEEIRRELEAKNPKRKQPTLTERLAALDQCFAEAEYEASVSSITGKIEHKPCNASFLIHKGHILHQHNKIALPTDGPSDERRVFAPGKTLETIRFKDQGIGLLVCDDLWVNRIYSVEKCNLIIAINAAPFTVDQYKTRIKLLKYQAASYQADIVYVNMVGCQDSMVYDGGSMVIMQDGTILHQSAFFEEKMDMITLYDKSTKPMNANPDDFGALAKNSDADDDKIPEYDGTELIYKALLLALKDHLRKNNLTDVVIGLSGGIDSTMTAVLAIDALGKDRVHLVTIPPRYTSEEILKDTKEFLAGVGMEATNIPIEPMFEESIKTTKVGELAQQSLQSRIRGLILMALSNEHGYMLLATGNKSEIAVGLGALYGDLNGEYNLLKDLYKTDVYELALWRNKLGPVIPKSIMIKALTTELAPNQKDTGTLPDYRILDEILRSYIEEGMTCETIAKRNKSSSDLTHELLALVQKAEFKRHQTPIGPKIRKRSFDLDWRMPISNKFVG
ncbi:MAG: NAD+ synthase [Pseudomonadota bacterium]